MSLTARNRCWSTRSAQSRQPRRARRRWRRGVRRRSTPGRRPRRRTAVDRPLDQATGGLGGDAELLADLAVAALAAVVQAEALLDRVAGPVVEHVEQARRPCSLLGLAMTSASGPGRVVGDEVDQLVGVVVADRPVEGGRGGEAVQPGVLVVELVAVAGHLAQRGTQAGRAVAGEADEAGLLVEGPADGLADPEGGVGGELEALAPVELVDGVLEAEVALLDEVEQVHAPGQGVAAGDAHHEAQVGPDEPVLGRGGSGHVTAQLGAALAGIEPGTGRHALLDDLRELSLLGRVQQRHGADLVEVLADGIAHCASSNR